MENDGERPRILWTLGSIVASEQKPNCVQRDMPMVSLNKSMRKIREAIQILHFMQFQVSLCIAYRCVLHNININTTRTRLCVLDIEYIILLLILLRFLTIFV